jgi:predicted RNA-binding Zn ribbon-like protein
MEPDGPHDGRWRLVGGRPCLDFVNTVGGRVSAPGRPARARDFADQVTRDHLPDFESLLRWAAYASLVPAPELERLRARARHEPPAARRVLARARRLRESLYRIGKALLEGWGPPAADLGVLDEELRQARSHQRLAAKGPRVEAEWAEGGRHLDRMLWPIAVSAAAVFASDEVERLKQCGGAACGWLFVDTTRNKSRRWCEMADCGNLAKVRRFRRRRRSRAGRTR